MCLAQGPQRSDAGEARTRGPSVSSQALYHCAPCNGSFQCPNWQKALTQKNAKGITKIYIFSPGNLIITLCQLSMFKNS